MSVSPLAWPPISRYGDVVVFDDVNTTNDSVHPRGGFTLKHRLYCAEANKHGEASVEQNCRSPGISAGG
jgi:hypothetical protein